MSENNKLSTFVYEPTLDIVQNRESCDGTFCMYAIIYYWGDRRKTNNNNTMHRLVAAKTLSELL